jgi:hypothetical protein
MLNKALARRLQRMFDDDQAACAEGRTDDNEPLFHQHAERLKDILAKHGWPGFSLVGEKASFAAWIIAQHSDHDLDFQVECLGMLHAAVCYREAKPRNLAYLIDRVLKNSGQPQIFGTQYHHPILDEAHVDERRALYGMEPMAAYLQWARIKHQS